MLFHKYTSTASFNGFQCWMIFFLFTLTDFIFALLILYFRNMFKLLSNTLR